MKPKKLIPINQLIDVPGEVSIPFDHLEIADLSALQREITLTTYIGPTIKVFITRGTKLRVKVVCKVSNDDAFAQKYGIQTVARTMSYVAGTLPVNAEKAELVPTLTGAGWSLPDEVTWQFDLPATMTGAQVLAAIRWSDEFIVRTTEIMFAQESKTQEQAAQS